jgi:hypothetical protein
MMVVIAFCGEKGSGKSTASEQLVQQFGFTDIALADPLKELISRVFRLSLEYFADPKLKDKDFGYDITVDYEHLDKLRSIVENDWDYTLTPEQREEIEEYHGYTFKSPREMMQTIGTDILRDIIDKDIFIRLLVQRIIHMETPVVITDVRFKNEREKLKKLGVVLCRIKRTFIDTDDKHKSENDLGLDDEYDAIFDNSESADVLKQTVNLWMTMRKDSIVIYNQFKIEESPYESEN